jgi:hypothetical protein
MARLGRRRRGVDSVGLAAQPGGHQQKRIGACPSPGQDLGRGRIGDPQEGRGTEFGLGPLGGEITLSVGHDGREALDHDHRRGAAVLDGPQIVAGDGEAGEQVPVQELSA